MCKKCSGYGERHEYVRVNGRKHYVIHPKRPSIRSKVHPTRRARTIQEGLHKMKNRYKPKTLGQLADLYD